MALVLSGTMGRSTQSPKATYAIAAVSGDIQGLSGKDDGGMDLGENHVKRRMLLVKSRQQQGSTTLDDTIRSSRELILAGGDVASQGFSKTASKSRKAMSAASGQNYVGMNATELSKFTNAESISRRKEELNYAMPTLRQVLRVDDSIHLAQIVRSQLCALPGDPTSRDKGPRRDPSASLRHMTSYRPV
mmetsp:Transcript_36420/g.58740  ORF Transcript_36420/g.58740 Transcript_36420/m.58740 type:complete len:189 (+) Transcript_36420:58-624(+)|eukprot:CAMPEP_0115090250 /NCGR_PEP_ID=MMETSP0227-20121206/25291_1 /TAXON_ID=89957 /ORGANISM="Polarella glacialis, Strain CCMP 1383" /LENGTH=188 /DNA_ID=CAMNT_0002481307 /DNA_START=50 /DNA_END=616 /DNA_ORIENTATION=+